jgi:hypothetical protein
MSLRRFILLLCAVALTSCTMHLPVPEAGRYRVQTHVAAVAARDTVPVYLLADHLHTGLVFELKWLEESGYVKPPEMRNHQYVTMSWGEQNAYVQQRWLSPIQVFRALCTPSPSVMEIIPINWKVEKVCHHQRVFISEVPRSAGISLAAFLNACAVKDAKGRPVTIGPSSWGNGCLIRCPENYAYYFPRICNVWTAQAMQSCGFDIRTASSLSANGLIREAQSQANGFKLIWDPEKQAVP